MFKTLEYNRFKELTQTHKKISVYKEIPGDQLTPIGVYLALYSHYKNTTILESNPKEKKIGRCSYICFDQIFEMKSYKKRILIEEKEKILEVKADPFKFLETYQKKLITKTDHPQSGFIGGLVGFISYDAIQLIENIYPEETIKSNLPDILFRSYKSNITFDHKTGKVIISTISLINSTSDYETSYINAIAEIDNIIKQLVSNKKNIQLKYQVNKNIPETNVDISDSDYKKMVNTAKQRIINGDIFQTVLSRSYSIPIKSEAFDIYRALRYSNPSPYMFYIPGDNYFIAGSSPEKLISITDKVIESCPLAGTRKRGDNLTDDEQNATELLTNKKEIAEHMMLVDLARNDIGAVSIPGTVKVTKLKEIEKYTRVMHISSTVQGVLRDDLSVFDAIKASFPAGTLSGAPKINSMKIINNLESTARGIYGGMICGIDSEGNLDSCIAIRTTLIQNGVATVRAGAGIVFDSNPEEEANETHQKAKAILEGILLAEGQQI